METHRNDLLSYAKLPPDHGSIYYLARAIFSSLFKLWGLRIYGLENLPTNGPAILASNHISLYDGPLLGSVTPKKMSAIGKAELFCNETVKQKVFAYLMRKIAVFPSHRNRVDRWAMRQAQNSLLRGETLVIFPEGTRSPNGELNDAKAGFGMICHNAKVPVVPVYIQGTEEGLSYKCRKIRPVTVRVYYGKPVPLNDLYEQPLKQSCHEIGKRVMQAIKDLKEEAR